MEVGSMQASESIAQIDFQSCHVMRLMLTKLVHKIIIVVVRCCAADFVCSPLLNTKKLPFVRI